MKKMFFFLFILSVIFMTMGCDPEVDLSSTISAPEFSDDSSYIEIGSIVTISTTTTGTTILYTLDSSDPAKDGTVLKGTDGSSEVDIEITEDVTIRAIAYTDSSVSTETTNSYIACYVYDTFEDGTVEGWLDTGLDDTVVGVDGTTGADGSSRSLKLDNTLDYGEYVDGSVHKIFADGISPAYVSFWGRFQEDFSTNYAEYALAVIFHTTTDTVEDERLLYHEFEMGDPNTITMRSDDYDSYGDVSINTWYLIEMRNIDWVALTFDFYLDGVLTAEDVAIPDSAGEPVRRITIGSDAGGAGEEQVAWIDQIIVR